MKEKKEEKKQKNKNQTRSLPMFGERCSFPRLFTKQMKNILSIFNRLPQQNAHELVHHRDPMAF